MPKHYIVAMVVALIGLGDSIYLTVQHLSGRSVRCTVTSGCSAVLSSAYATLGGIPTAAYGIAAYFAAFSLATMAVFGARRIAITASAPVITPSTRNGRCGNPGTTPRATSNTAAPTSTRG